MTGLFRTRITAVWLCLVIATALSWEMGHGFPFSEPRAAGIAIIALALLKVRFVIFEFMELRCAPGFMRWAAEGWLAALGVLLICLYLGLVRLPA